MTTTNDVLDKRLTDLETIVSIAAHAVSSSVHSR